MTGIPRRLQWPPGRVDSRMKGALRKIGLWILWLLIATLALAALFIAATPQGRAGFQTALFVSQMLDLPVNPQAWFTDEPLRQEVRYSESGVALAADVYRLPDGKPRAAALLSVGATPHGLDDPGIVTLGDALARAGYVAMLHWSPEIGLRSNMDPSEADRLVEAFLYMEGLEYVDPERVGIGGFCVGASLALVAAADPAIRERVDFVNAFGPFFDAEALMLQAVSRTVEYNGESASWQPHRRTMEFLTTELIENLDSASDARILTRHYLDQEEPTPADRETLTPQGRIAARLLDGVRPDEARELYETLPAAFHEDLSRISPSTYVEGLHARLLVLHTRGDEYVPSAESRRLLDATKHRLDVRYTEFIGFDHLLPDEDNIFARTEQAFKLYRHMYSILRIAS